MTEPIIKFDCVCKSFGELEVLKDLSLEVAPREHIALIGPSGSGKTTILRIQGSFLPDLKTQTVTRFSLELLQSLNTLVIQSPNEEFSLKTIFVVG